jgi:transcriptional regulator with XRE-family HTH domain
MIMAEVKTVADWMGQRGLRLAELVEGSGLDRKVVEAIVHGRYTPSPQQRQRLAAVLGVAVEQVAWGYRVPVDHMYGHGPQFGRSP